MLAVDFPTQNGTVRQTSEFAAVLHRILTRDRTRSMRDIAVALGLSYPAFYARLSGRVPFSIDEARAVLAEIPDHRLVDALLAGTRFGGFERAQLRGGSTRVGPFETALQVVQHLTTLMQGLSIGIERDEIERQILEAERGLAALRQILPHARASHPTAALHGSSAASTATADSSMGSLAK